MVDKLNYEKSLWDKGLDLIAGVDEVGRGALAGPMVVGAVILKADDLKQLDLSEYTNNDVSKRIFETNLYLQIKDSKLLTPKKRGELSAFIIQNCLCYSVFEIPSQEIDSYGISACTQKGFSEVVKSLKIKPEHVLTDAFPIKAFPQAIQTNIISGDRVSLTIAAASIVAKVFRDSLMCDLGKLPSYSCYGFERHKGYGTKLHMENILKHGPSDIHRRSFIHLK